MKFDYTSRSGNNKTLIQDNFVEHFGILKTRNVFHKKIFFQEFTNDLSVGEILCRFANENDSVLFDFIIVGILFFIRHFSQILDFHDLIHLIYL